MCHLPLIRNSLTRAACWRTFSASRRLPLIRSVLLTLGCSMADKTDVLLQLYAEERAQARQSETQRATLTNIVIVIVGASLAFISDQN